MSNEATELRNERSTDESSEDDSSLKTSDSEDEQIRPQTQREFTNLYIKHFNHDVDDALLEKVFEKFGTITSAKVMRNANGVSKKFGFVAYKNHESAEKCVRMLHRQKVHQLTGPNHSLYVQPAQKKAERLLEIQKSLPNKNLYVKHIMEDVDEERLKEHFSRFGAIKHVKVQRDREGDSKRFAFVEFEEMDSAITCLLTFHDESVEGLTRSGIKLYVQPFESKEARTQTLKTHFLTIKAEPEDNSELNTSRAQHRPPQQDSNLYVKNLEKDMDEQDLETEFRRFGEITSVKIQRDDENHSKGFGFVCFSTPEAAHKAIQEMNGRILKVKPLYVSLYQAKNVRKQQLTAAKTAQRNARWITDQADSVRQPTLNTMQNPPTMTAVNITSPRPVTMPHPHSPQAPHRHFMVPHHSHMVPPPPNMMPYGAPLMARPPGPPGPPCAFGYPPYIHPRCPSQPPYRLLHPQHIPLHLYPQTAPQTFNDKTTTGNANPEINSQTQGRMSKDQPDTKKEKSELAKQAHQILAALKKKRSDRDND